MALFKSEVEKTAEALAKEQRLLEKYGLETMGDAKDIQSIKKIINELTGTGMMEAGMKLAFKAKPEDKLQVIYQRAILEQNFIIIHQLDKLSAYFEKLVDLASEE